MRELTKEYELKRDYLKADEIRYIAETMLAFDNYIDREICEILLIANYLTDIEIKTETDENGDEVLNLTSTQYDELYECGIADDLYEKVTNVNQIDWYVSEKESIYNVFNKISDDIKSSLDNIDTKFNAENILSELAKIKDSTNFKTIKAVIDDGK